MELRILPMDLNFDNNLKQWAEVVLEIVDIDKTKLSPKNIIFIEEASRSGVESDSWIYEVLKSVAGILSKHRETQIKESQVREPQHHSSESFCNSYRDISLLSVF